MTAIIGEGSDGWGLFYKSRAMVAAGEAVTELTIGEHDIRTDPIILDAMQRAALAGHTGYASVPGIPALRRHVADRIASRTGVATGPENIIITPGGQAALFASFMATCDPGDTAAFIDPYYATYPGTIRSAGAIPRAIPADPHHAFQPQAKALEAAAGARALLVNSPNNPTGVVYGDATLAAIGETCRRHDLWLISDEVYDTQVWQGRHRSPRSLPDMVDRTLVVGSLSKSHAMTGSRVGWICAPQAMIDRLIELATNTTYGIPGYIQDAALFALEQGTAFEDRIAAPFARRRLLTQEVLAGQNLVKAVPIQGAMYAMLDIRGTGLSGEDFGHRLLAEERIAVMPGESFGQAAAGHVRVAMTIGDDAYREALQRLVAFAAKLAT